MKNIKYVAIGSVARSGKDTLANAMKINLENRGFKVIKKSLAAPLKSICDPFLLEHFGFSAFTEKTEEKNIIRPFLVTVGGMFRRQTLGKYFTNLLQSEINKLEEKPDFVICPDCRYAEYPDTDELFFFKNVGGYIININRIDENGELIHPPNDDEYINSAKIANGANLNVTWPTYKSVDCEEVKEMAEFCVKSSLKYFA